MSSPNQTLEASDQQRAEDVAVKVRSLGSSGLHWLRQGEAVEVIRDAFAAVRAEQAASDTAQHDRYERFFVELGKTLKSGGMNDPAFLTGAIQAVVEVCDKRGERIAALEQALREIENAELGCWCEAYKIARAALKGSTNG